MVEIREIKSKKEQKEFLLFPIRLYRGNPCFVPPLWADEKKIFRSDYVYADICDSVFFGAYRDGKMVGRIQGILQKASNEKRNERRVRFSRFDAIDDQEVADGLFSAVERWALSLGMDTVCGPLGYSDLEREGLLIEGFDQLSTFEEQYNAEYYQRLIASCGYEKEVDWTESRLRANPDDDGKLRQMADFIMKRYRLRLAESKNISDFLERYGDDVFDLVDRTYDGLYGTVPFTDGMKKMTIDNFKLILSTRYVAAIVDENDRVICFGVTMPSIAKAVQKSNGHLTPLALIRLLSAIKKPKILDLALIGVDPEYANRGISTVFMAHLQELLSHSSIEYAETNLNLEDNFSITNSWKRFDAVQHKRRRSYVKKLAAAEGGNADDQTGN